MLRLADVPAHFAADRAALIQGEARWTFGDLDQRSAMWAAWLQERGVGDDDLVAFVLPNGPEFLALTFGIYRAGATPAPLSAKLPLLEREAILAVMRPRLLVTEADAPADDRSLSDHVAVAWKACTSGGSTGTPKVIVDGRPAAFADGTDFIGIPANETVLVPGPLYHNAPFSAAVFALWRGCTVVTMPRFDASAALALIEAEHVSWSLMVPTMLHRIWSLPADQRDSRDLSSWRMVVHTAAPMPQWLKRSWIDWRGADHIWEVYGATEGLVRCWIGGIDWLQRPGSVGRPIGGARLRILDDAGAEVPAGELGEVFAMPPGGAGSSYHYIGAERRTTADGWESVGDCGWVDADGFLYLADRRTDLIISGGVNIWPAEVEAALLRHPDIRSCAVHGVSDADLGQRVHAIVESDAPLDAEGLHTFLAEWLTRDKWPRSFDFRREPVRDDAGKFRKTAVNPEPTE
ncbi:acid--CoA ligase [Sphingomonas koreensis]|uniref:Acid--CoA ligase n=1 Tax=Sphingomonas koreensis TaxID=93064 RepID=A0A430FZZ2_9SPHN|nr:AMP-binding protein [Sphingomonas koreensis]RSY79316.1 acid--CoA ligase [Sphingomonas koreensis]